MMKLIDYSLNRTFVAISYGIKVDIVLIVVDEHETEPRVKRVDGHYKQYPYYPSLLIRTGVISNVAVYL